MSDTGYFIGVISGTSVDAIDCALVAIDASGISLVDTYSGQYVPELRQQILDLCDSPEISLKQLGTLDIRVGKAFASAINTLLNNNKLAATSVLAIGSHGQTVFHQPEGEDRFSMQIGDPNVIAELTGITTVADFRRRDMAAGGQGAPLAPLFHQHFFFQPEKSRCVVNIGGMANVTWLNSDPETTPKGYDTGPGNVLMDYWIGQHQGTNYDAGGAWANSGKVHPGLLDQLLSEPYFRLPAPKSTGRELFNGAWLKRQLDTLTELPPAQDVQRTLLELTARSIAAEVSPGSLDQLIVCGGGAHNIALLQRLQALQPSVEVSSSDDCGLSADWVEAVTFAWLAQCTLGKKAIDSRELTGASHPVILGGVYYHG